MASISVTSPRASSPLRNALTAFGIILAVLAAIAVIQSLPILLLKPLGAHAYASDHVLLYYQPGDETGAKDVFDLVNRSIARINEQMKFQADAPVQIYVYKDQSSLWMRKYGLVTLLFAPTWYVGDNRGDKVLLVSPNAPVQGHSHDSIVGAVLHEVVHTINYQKNPKLSYFWDNGLATYITGQVPPQGALSPFGMPTLEQMHTENEMEFGNMGGYDYSYSYIQYLDKTYGWDRVIEFAAGGKTYEQVFGASEQEIYNGWAEYLKQ